jgi:hypothetical protein
MLCLPLAFRRCFAAFAALIVLFAPITQVAHAQAMTRVAPECAPPASSHQHAPSSKPHTQQHHHDGACCDFCGAGCAAALALPARVTPLATLISGECMAAGAPTRRFRLARLPHAFPFSLAPPLPTV